MSYPFHRFFPRSSSFGSRRNPASSSIVDETLTVASPAVSPGTSAFVPPVVNLACNTLAEIRGSSYARYTEPGREWRKRESVTWHNIRTLLRKTGVECDGFAASHSSRIGGTVVLATIFVHYQRGKGNLHTLYLDQAGCIDQSSTTKRHFCNCSLFWKTRHGNIKTNLSRTSTRSTVDCPRIMPQ